MPSLKKSNTKKLESLSIDELSTEFHRMADVLNKDNNENPIGVHRYCYTDNYKWFGRSEKDIRKDREETRLKLDSLCDIAEVLKDKIANELENKKMDATVARDHIESINNVLFQYSNMLPAYTVEYKGSYLFARHIAEYQPTAKDIETQNRIDAIHGGIFRPSSKPRKF